MNHRLLSLSRTVHVYLSLVLLLVLVFFSITGITLNHATSLTTEPHYASEMIESLPELPRDDQNRIAASAQLDAFLQERFGIRMAQAVLSYEDNLLIIDYQAPGRTLLLELDQELGEGFFESTDFGLVAFLNDLHKGRNVDVLFRWLIDISGAVLVVFSLAGLVLLLPNRRRFHKVLRYSVIGLAVLSLGYFLGTQ